MGANKHCIDCIPKDPKLTRSEALGFSHAWGFRVGRTRNAFAVSRTTRVGSHEEARSYDHGTPTGVPYPYRGTLFIRNRAPIGPYSGTMPRALGWSLGVGMFPLCEVPLYITD